MPDEATKTAEEQAADDWSAALAEEAATKAAAGEDKDEADASLDWGAALAEQTESEAAQAALTTGGSAEATQFEDISGKHQEIDFILDIPVQLTVEMGRTKIPIKNLLQLAQGSVVELDGLAGEPMDVLINGCLIAQGEVVVVNDKFGIRLTDVITPAERIKKLNR